MESWAMPLKWTKHLAWKPKNTSQDTKFSLTWLYKSSTQEITWLLLTFILFQYTKWLIVTNGTFRKITFYYIHGYFKGLPVAITDNFNKGYINTPIYI